MKHLKISFLALVAIIAVGVTAAVKADASKKQAAVLCRQVDGDYKSVIIGTVQYYNPDAVVPAPSPVPPATSVSSSCPGEGTLSATPVIPLDLNEEIECDNSLTQVFCCAKATSTPGQFTIVCKRQL